MRKKSVNNRRNEKMKTKVRKKSQKRAYISQISHFSKPVIMKLQRP